MLGDSTSTSTCTWKQRSLESQPLVSYSQRQRRIVPICSTPVRFCIASKAAILILLWTVCVGALNNIISTVVLIMLLLMTQLPYVSESLPFVILYSSIALVFMFYPLNGYLADVCCGRFKMIVASLTLLLCSLIICMSCFVLSILLTLSNTLETFLDTVGILCLFTAVIGIAGYGANFIQFGLDQLLEVPSHYQALFVHWAKWCNDLMSVVFDILIIYGYCYVTSITTQVVTVSSVVIFFEFMLLLLLMFGCWKHSWFYSEPGHHNPYRMVIKVLVFAWKHKNAFQRSAFTYCDDERPSRLDFAKERFGGPFTTEQVEDVKTFLRIVGILLVVGPTSILDVPTSTLAMAIIGSHLGPGILFCEWEWIVVNSGLLRYIVSTFFLPIYVWIIFSVLQKRVPKILCRLGIGILLYFLGVLSMFVGEIIGHPQNQRNNTQCISLVQGNSSSYLDISSFDMPWAVNLPSNLLIGIGPTLVTATIFEFISAQSPHSMKGLLLGTHFAIKGAYQFISSVALVPFTSYKLQDSEQHSLHTGCLFGYLLYICVIALIGLILFSVAARKYKYRERDDRPYDQRFVIDVYNRYLNQVQDNEPSSDSDSD